MEKLQPVASFGNNSRHPHLAHIFLLSEALTPFDLMATQATPIDLSVPALVNNILLLPKLSVLGVRDGYCKK
jgi:hypothetical protein